PDACRYTTAATNREGGPEESAGGIRTRGLELMRLARTASPPPRRSAWLESNQRSPAPAAGGVTASQLAGARSTQRHDRPVLVLPRLSKPLAYSSTLD